MIEGTAPRLFALPPGADFPAGVVEGLGARLQGAEPEAWGRVTLLLNSGRMLRRVRAAFDAGPARLLPRLLLVSDLEPLARGIEVPAALPVLGLTLHLARMLEALAERDPTLVPRHAIFDLARTLAVLIDEMEGEGDGPETLARIDAGPFAAHWQRSEAIVRAAYAHFARLDGMLPGAEARRRRLVDALVERWPEVPPPGPILLAGSTGSRGTTRRLMAAVARLEEGAVILPGYDFGMPLPHWRALDAGAGTEDHPQFRFRALLRELDLAPQDVVPWAGTKAPDPGRNRLVSLALCPAPVTDRWRDEGAALGDPAALTAGLTLIEAQGPRQEAAAIAVAIRAGVEEGRRTALVTPDRELTRQVAARLMRWGIEADDSGGTPLHQTPPGRFMRLIAGMMARPPDLPDVLSLLKHPLTASGGDRGAHLLAVRRLELHMRRHGIAQPDGSALTGWDGAPEGWAAWCGSCWQTMEAARAPATVASLVTTHLRLAEEIARGPEGTGPGGLWDEEAGRAARAAMRDLETAASAYDAGYEGAMQPRSYGDLLLTLMQGRQVLDPRRPHPGVMIWGTLEARAQGAERVILAGLNEGVWPAAPAPDPWLNRQMRQEAGLLSPERAIGLSAHDFQQAAGAGEVILSRARRDAEAPTIPSRWLNRLTNLLRGLGDEGQAALEQMHDRGATWLRLAARLDAPAAKVESEARPSPRPPLRIRPDTLSVTRVTVLVRDPYAIYAQYVLGLRALNPLMPRPDARARGTALHDVMEAFLASRAGWRDDADAARHALLRAADAQLPRWSADPAVRALWRARLVSIAERLAEREVARLAEAEPALTEDQGRLALTGLAADLERGFTLTATPDRIDRYPDGAYAVRDYKTGAPPSDKEVRHFDRQLPLTAAILERGGFTGLAAGPVREMEYVTLGRSDDDRILAMEDDGARVPDLAIADLERLLRRYGKRVQGYTAQRAAARRNFEGDYDHLARFGEWELTDTAAPVDVGPPDGPEGTP